MISIGRPFIDRLGATASSAVDAQVEANSRLLVYRVLSRTNSMWQGLYEACEWTEMHQALASYPLIKSKNLFLIANSYFYQVSGAANESEYESYSSTIDTIIASFHLTQ